MARGFAYADGASREVDEASRPIMHRATVVMHAQSRNALVREIIARRPDLPIGLTVTLAHDASEDVRAAIAGNPVVAQAVLEHLATDRSVSVLIALVSNPSLGPGSLGALLFHTRPEVRRASADRLDSRGPHLVAVREDASVPEIRDVAVNSSVTSVLPSPVVVSAPLASGHGAPRPARAAPSASSASRRTSRGTFLPSTKGPPPWRS
jgi:hypothetical protein